MTDSEKLDQILALMGETIALDPRGLNDTATSMQLPLYLVKGTVPMSMYIAINKNDTGTYFTLSIKDPWGVPALYRTFKCEVDDAFTGQRIK